MIKSSDSFGAARLKVDWAHKHIGHLESAFETFVNDNVGDVVIEQDPQTRHYTLGLRAPPPVIPSAFPLLIGDIAHNLRSALDYVTSEIVRKGETRVHFPVAETRKELVSSEFLARIEKANPVLAEIILHHVKPYLGGNDALVWLSRINNIDKHRFLTPTFVISGLTGVCFTDENQNTFRNWTMSVGLGGFIEALRNDAEMTIHDYGKPIGEILFSAGSPLEGKPIAKTLMVMARNVASVIETLEAFHFGNRTADLIGHRTYPLT